MTIATRRRAKALPTAANDNKAPMRLRLIRVVKLVALLAATAGMLWYLLRP
ncbi:hypothetical protein N825_19825 [Skermanella stibiiresistens SB22]|uniref:Uncharacterized protein n=1 Tax=Skermanella stibiiresistens SB22 TaxID=1385369 RepID=W9H8J2_9PROT|nr:hypothetical protein [Skermanella stibiiresistens]EWY42354.1 hypothetical protein N825_19825 [Skermanella stibiiresistens SB22]